MCDKVEIDKAVVAHGQWKARLKTAIATGHSEIPVATIQADDKCGFGQWLYSPSIAPAEKASATYRAVKELHAQFHRVAARVAELGMRGQKGQAEEMMASGGEFAATSSKLTLALVEWRKTAK